MKEYSHDELDKTVIFLTKTIAKCTKMQVKFKVGTSQHSLLVNRIKALEICKALIEAKETNSLAELNMALPPIVSIISKTSKGQSKYVKGSKQYQRFVPIIEAMEIAKDYLKEEINKQGEKMRKKLLLFDVDGTLISYDGTVPQSCKDALKAAKEAGNYVFVVTGRTKNRAIVGDIEVSGMICGNGAYIEVEGKVLQDKKLSEEQTARIADYLDEHDISYFMEGNEGLYGSKHFETRSVPTYIKYGHPKPVIRELYPLMEFPQSMHQKNITKINYILNSYQDYLDFKAFFNDFKCLTWGGAGEEALFGDCALPGIDKQAAINLLITYLDIPKEDIYAFGDAEVDIPMFKCARTSICVGSGRQGAKDVATYVTADVMDDGIAKALQHFKII